MRILLRPLGRLLIWLGHKLCGEVSMAEYIEMEPYGDITLPPDEAWMLAVKKGRNDV